MKFAFIGASVTAQGIHHESKVVTGYREFLSKRIVNNLGFDDIRSFTHGGNRMSDGGLLNLVEIINFKPDICLVEPLIEDAARGEKSSNKEIHFFYETLLEYNIFPITVFLPDPSKGHCKDWVNYENYKSIIFEKGLPLIEDIHLPSVEDRKSYFRGVHTTTKGAELYSNKIYNHLVKIIDSNHSNHENVEIRTTKLYVMKLSGVDSNNLLEKEFTLIPIGNNFYVQIKIIQLSKIGSYSPVLEYTISNDSGDILSGNTSIWDPYCHYERKSFSILLPRTNIGKGKVYLKLSLSSNSPSYDKCHRKSIKWPEKNELRLNPLDDAYMISNSKLKINLNEEIITGMDLFELSSHYSMGLRVPARFNNPCFRKGWSYGESWGRWTDGEEAVISLLLNDYHGEKIQAIFSIKHQDRVHGHCCVSIFNNEIEYEFNDGILSFSIETLKDKNINIIFRFPLLKARLDKGEVVGERKLGIGIDWFQFIY
jgi:hypothetical protein